MPTMPSRLPLTLLVSANPPSSHRPARTKRSAAAMRLEVASISPTARSATSSVSTSGVLVTAMPSSRAAARSTESRPTLKQAISFNLGSCSINARLMPAPPPLVTTTSMRGATSRNQCGAVAGIQQRVRRIGRFQLRLRWLVNRCDEQYFWLHGRRHFLYEWARTFCRCSPKPAIPSVTTSPLFR